jgi:hypothetical protein
MWDAEEFAEGEQVLVPGQRAEHPKSVMHILEGKRTSCESVL